MELKDLYMGINRGKRYTLKSDFISEAEAYTSGKHRYFTPWALSLGAYNMIKKPANIRL